MFDASKVYKRIFIFLFVNLIAHLNNVSCQTASTARCNECFTNGVACLDEQNFSICIGGTPINVRTNCPTGEVCTSEEEICQATAQGGIPACFVDKCGKCLSAEKNFACLDENIYAFCYDGQTPDPSSINYCPLGNVCDLNNTNICSPTQSAIPSCILDSTTDTTTETTTDLTTATSTDSTTDSTTQTTTDTTTDSTTQTTTDTTTDSTTETTTDSSSVVTTDTTTDSTTTSTSTDTTASTTTITTKATTTETTPISTSTDTTTATSTVTTTVTTTETTPTSTSTDATTTSSTVAPTDTTTVTTTPSTTDTTTQTTAAPKDPNTFCTEIGRVGYFRADGDKTCAKYIYCYKLSGQYLGWEYTCANYFNAETGKCQTERPADC